MTCTDIIANRRHYGEPLRRSTSADEAAFTEIVDVQATTLAEETIASSHPPE